MCISKKHAILLFGLIVGLGVASGLVANEFGQNLSDKELCGRLYASYEQFGDNLVQLPIITDASIDRCVKVLQDDQKKVTDQIAALSYKNIIFSRKNAKNLLLAVGGRYVYAE